MNWLTHLDRMACKAYAIISCCIMKLKLYFAKKCQMDTMYQLPILTMVLHFKVGIRQKYGAKYHKCQKRLLEDIGQYEFPGISTVYILYWILKNKIK